MYITKRLHQVKKKEMQISNRFREETVKNTKDI